MRRSNNGLSHLDGRVAQLLGLLVAAGGQGLPFLDYQGPDLEVLYGAAYAKRKKGDRSRVVFTRAGLMRWRAEQRRRARREVGKARTLGARYSRVFYPMSAALYAGLNNIPGGFR